MKRRENRQGKRRLSRSMDTVIGKDASFEGTLDIQEAANICIDGRFKGSLQTLGGVILTRRSEVEADIQAQHVVVNGKLIGDITADQELYIGKTGHITGNVKVGSIHIELGGSIKGSCEVADSAAQDETPAIQKAETRNGQPIVINNPTITVRKAG